MLPCENVDEGAAWPCDVADAAARASNSTVVRVSLALAGMDSTRKDSARASASCSSSDRLRIRWSSSACRADKAIASASALSSSSSGIALCGALVGRGGFVGASGTAGFGSYIGGGDIRLEWGEECVRCASCGEEDADEGPGTGE
jgi:hypothetical protein